MILYIFTAIAGIVAALALIRGKQRLRTAAICCLLITIWLQVESIPPFMRNMGSGLLLVEHVRTISYIVDVALILILWIYIVSVRNKRKDSRSKTE